MKIGICRFSPARSRQRTALGWAVLGLAVPLLALPAPPAEAVTPPLGVCTTRDQTGAYRTSTVSNTAAEVGEFEVRVRTAIPEVAGGNPVATRINDTLRADLARSERNMESVLQDAGDNPIDTPTLDVGCKSIELFGNFLSVLIRTDSYYGGAHGFSTSVSHLFSLDTGVDIGSRNLFKPNTDIPRVIVDNIGDRSQLCGQPNGEAPSDATFRNAIQLGLEPTEGEARATIAANARSLVVAFDTWALEDGAFCGSKAPIVSIPRDKLATYLSPLLAPAPVDVDAPGLGECPGPSIAMSQTESVTYASATGGRVLHLKLGNNHLQQFSLDISGQLRAGAKAALGGKAAIEGAPKGVPKGWGGKLSGSAVVGVGGSVTFDADAATSRQLADAVREPDRFTLPSKDGVQLSKLSFTNGAWLNGDIGVDSGANAAAGIELSGVRALTLGFKDWKFDSVTTSFGVQGSLKSSAGSAGAVALDAGASVGSGVNVAYTVDSQLHPKALKFSADLATSYQPMNIKTNMSIKDLKAMNLALDSKDETVSTYTGYADLKNNSSGWFTAIAGFARSQRLQSVTDQWSRAGRSTFTESQSRNTTLGASFEAGSGLAVGGGYSATTTVEQPRKAQYSAGSRPMQPWAACQTLINSRQWRITDE